MNWQTNQAAYLAYAKSLTDDEREAIDELGQWLPAEIIDCHAHCNLPEQVRWIDERARNHMLSTFPSFDLNESKEWHALFHPEKTIRSLRFPGVFRGINHKLANLYLLKQSDPQDRVALYGLPDNPSYTTEMLTHSRVSGLKMYYMYFEPPATQIYQYFPPVILEIAQARNIPIILHLPRKIVDCLDQILKLVSDFPRLRICIAHLGLSKKVVTGLKEAFTLIAEHPLISCDTALVPSAEVIALAIETLGIHRIMYGSDEPLHLIRSVPYLHPEHGERLSTPYPYHWVDPLEHDQYKHLAAGAAHAHWSALRAIKAVLALPQPKQGRAKLLIFHDNAQLFYGF